MKNQYDATKHYDRVCFLLRKGDFELLRVACPGGVSAWIRNQIAEHVDELRAEQRRRERAQQKAWEMAAEDI